MTTKALRELDAYTAEFVMGWTRIKSRDRKNALCFNTARGDYFWTGEARAPEDYECDHPDREMWNPTQTPSDTMRVLERCVSKTLFVRISDASVSVVKRFIVTGDGGMSASAETLPLAICLFAKILFAKKD